MKDVLILIAVVFVTVSIILFPTILKSKDSTARGAFLAIWGLIGFFFVSWLVSAGAWQGMEFVSSAAQSAGIPFWIVLLSPVVLTGIVGGFNKKRKGR